jgi:ATPase subunit of ABC transporter with duplicated ATPase domains
MIQLKNLSLSFPHKTCFEDFSTDIYDGNRIAIIGRNGSGKSSLLEMIKDIPADINIGYVLQIIEDFDNLSGGQRFNKSLTKALSKSPDLLLLDEPTNHLDQSNRKSLIRMLNSYPGILIIASHDLELLNNYIDILWHINDGTITKFIGNYDDYMHELQAQRTSITKELSRLERQKDSMHLSLMKEQARASKSRKKGENLLANASGRLLLAILKLLMLKRLQERRSQILIIKNRC